MTPEEAFERLLGLGKAWHVVEARLKASSSTFVLKVEETAALWPGESVRASTSVTYHDYVEPMQWRHPNVFYKECVIVCALPRGRRSKHFSQEFEAFAVTLIRKMPVKRAGQILGESDSRMLRMLFAHVKAAHARLSFDNVMWVGADEMNRRKWTNYLTVVADLKTKQVLFPLRSFRAAGDRQLLRATFSMPCNEAIMAMISRERDPSSGMLSWSCRRTGAEQATQPRSGQSRSNTPSGRTPHFDRFPRMT